MHNMLEDLNLKASISKIWNAINLRVSQEEIPLRSLQGTGNADLGEAPVYESCGGLRAFAAMQEDK